MLSDAVKPSKIHSSYIGQSLSMWNADVGFTAAYTCVKLVLIHNGSVPVMHDVVVSAGRNYSCWFCKSDIFSCMEYEHLLR